MSIWQSLFCSPYRLFTFFIQRQLKHDCSLKLRLQTDHRNHKSPVPKTNQTKLSEYLFANFNGWQVLQQCNNTPIMTIILAYVGVLCSAGTTYQIKKSAAHSDNVNTVFVHDLSRAWNDVHICTHLINCIHTEGNPVMTCCFEGDGWLLVKSRWLFK